MGLLPHIRLSLDGMSCGACASRAAQALGTVGGVRDVSVNLATQTASFAAADAETLRAAAGALQAAGYGAEQRSVRISIAQMSCAACALRVERALMQVPGVLESSVNFASHTAHLRCLADVAEPERICAASTAAGYPAALEETAQLTPRRALCQDDEARALARGAALAAALTLPVFVMEMGGHLFPALHMAIARGIGMQAAWVVQSVLTTLVLLGPGRQFFTRGLPALARGAPDMNSLVALGTGAAWTYSMLATYAPGLLPPTARAVYFEAAAVIVVLILLGRWLEARAKGRTGAAIEALLDLRVRDARTERDGAVQMVAIENLLVGDIVQLRPGERVPLDAEIIEGQSHLDESMITGEPMPVAKSPGDGVTGGTVNGNGALRLRVTRLAGDSVLAQIVRMVEAAQGARLPIQRLVDRVTLWFVPGVLALAALTVLCWLALGPAPAVGPALVAGVCVLIVACPCAMGLATPTSIMVATGRAAQMGVLFRRGDALQALGAVDVVALDKTGTVTEGTPALTELEPVDGFTRAEVLGLLAAVEAQSEHPVAGAILRAAQAEGIAHPQAGALRALPGYGAQADVQGRCVLVGAQRLMAREGIDISGLAARTATLGAQGRTVLYAAVDGRAAALVAVSDPIKPGSAAAICALGALGLRVAMITGDTRSAGMAVARQVGIETVIADVLPGGKVAALDDLGADGARVAFVGDGINDAPALAHADTGIAIGTGTDVAIESADVVLLSGDLGGVVDAVSVSRAAMRNIRQNLVWAFGYNAALIPLAAGAFYPFFGLMLSPAFAAGAMALSSVSVLANALRLRGLKRSDPGNVAADRGAREKTG